MAGCIAGCQYIPSIEYFAHWLHHGTIVLEAHEHFQKRTWRNKTAIQGSEKPLLLSVPLKKGKHDQKPIQEVEISYDEPWHKIHFNTICTAYGKTPYFNEMESDLKNILFGRFEKLWDLNLEMIRYLLTLLPHPFHIELSTGYQPNYPPEIVDLRNGVPGGLTDLSIDNIPIYEQIHRLGKTHSPNLSILDSLCHLGPGTIEYISRYSKQLYP